MIVTCTDGQPHGNAHDNLINLECHAGFRFAGTFTPTGFDDKYRGSWFMMGK